MSKIDKTYFRWNESSVNIGIRLGDSKESLIKTGLIEVIDSEEKTDFAGVNGTPWRVNFDNEKVSGIWFNRDSSFNINGNEICGESYDLIKPIIESKFQSLNSEINSIEEMKSYNESNILYIICRDFFVTMVGIIKTEYSKS